MEFQTPQFVHAFKRLLDSLRFRVGDFGHRLNSTLMGRAHDVSAAAGRISDRAEIARGRAQDAAGDVIGDGASWVAQKTGWDEIRARMAARAEEAAIRRRLWWARVHAAWADRASAVAWWVSTHLENARWWLLDRLGPPARRVADRLEAASARAAARREQLAQRLADFRDRHGARLPKAVRDLGLPQAERAIMSLRFNWKFAAMAVLAVCGAVLLREMTRPAPPAPPTKDEIALVRGFIRPSTGAVKGIAPAAQTQSQTPAHTRAQTKSPGKAPAASSAHRRTGPDAPGSAGAPPRR